MLLKGTLCALGAARGPSRPLCLPRLWPSLSSPSLWSPLTLQAHPRCPSPRSPPLLLPRLPPRCHALHSPNLSPRCWPPTTSSWYRASTRSSSPRLTMLNCSSWCSATRGPSSRPRSNMPSCLRRAPCCSRPLCRTAPPAGGVRLTTAACSTAAYSTRRDREGT